MGTPEQNAADAARAAEVAKQWKDAQDRAKKIAREWQAKNRKRYDT